MKTNRRYVAGCGLSLSGRLFRVATLGALVLLQLAASGCKSMQPEMPAPSNGMRDSASGSAPSGMDERARQIESNLGIR